MALFMKGDAVSFLIYFLVLFYFHSFFSLFLRNFALTNKWECNQIVFQVQTLLDSVKWDDKGLAVAIAQNVDTGAILMQGFANRDAVTAAISSRKAMFFSRSRSMLWTKGETSNNFINIHDIFFDCDRDSVCFEDSLVGKS